LRPVHLTIEGLACFRDRQEIDFSDLELGLPALLTIVIMPFTYYPILKSARDPALMGEHTTRKVQDILGWIFFGIVVIAAVAAIPLMVVTHSGQP
jgi:hypothetical protein